MGILTGMKIKEEVEKGNIVIDPFDVNKINPNSFNLTLGSDILVYEQEVLSTRKTNEFRRFFIDRNEGATFVPGELYLAQTNERTFTDKYVPAIEGRSSVARLGVNVHITAGFGDIGFNGFWTLEISCVKPVVVYPDVDICQIYFMEYSGDPSIKYCGKYQNNNGVVSSLLHKDFERK